MRMTFPFLLPLDDADAEDATEERSESNGTTLSSNPVVSQPILTTKKRTSFCHQGLPFASLRREVESREAQWLFLISAKQVIKASSHQVIDMDSWTWMHDVVISITHQSATQQSETQRLSQNSELPSSEVRTHFQVASIPFSPLSIHHGVGECWQSRPFGRMVVIVGFSNRSRSIGSISSICDQIHEMERRNQRKKK